MGAAVVITVARHEVAGIMVVEVEITVVAMITLAVEATIGPMVMVMGATEVAVVITMDLEDVVAEDWAGHQSLDHQLARQLVHLLVAAVARISSQKATGHVQTLGKLVPNFCFP